MEWLDPAADLFIPGSAIGASAWLFYRLFLRSDRRERDAFLEVKAQRDEYRLRMETAEEHARELAHDLALYRRRFGALDDRDG